MTTHGLKKVKQADKQSRTIERLADILIQNLQN